MKYKYKIVKKNKDAYEQVIEKSGLTVQFTLTEVENQISQINEKLVELNAQFGLESAAVHNIEENHPYLMKIKAELLSYSHTYKTALDKRDVVNSTIKKYKSALRDIRKQKKEIMKVCKIAEKTDE